MTKVKEWLLIAASAVCLAASLPAIVVVSVGGETDLGCTTRCYIDLPSRGTCRQADRQIRRIAQTIVG